eukprot:768506-Hanusia_phi.AAC.4
MILWAGRGAAPGACAAQSGRRRTQQGWEAPRLRPSAAGSGRGRDRIIRSWMIIYFTRASNFSRTSELSRQAVLLR